VLTDLAGRFLCGLAERFPFMKGWRQSEVLAVHERFEEAREEEREAIAGVIGCASLMDSELALRMIDNSNGGTLYAPDPWTQRCADALVCHGSVRAFPFRCRLPLALSPRCAQDFHNVGRESAGLLDDGRELLVQSVMVSSSAAGFFRFRASGWFSARNRS
jgi:hypothetical protein